MPIILPGPIPAQPTTLQTFIADLCLELGLTAPNRIVGSADPQILQMLALSNRLGNDLVREYEWQQLTVVANITTVSGQVRYQLPNDWNRQIPQTEWNRSTHWPMIGPLSSQSWETFKGSYVSACVETLFRIQGGDVVLLNAPPDGETLAFEYISKNWVVGPSGEHYNRFLSDEDTFLFDENLMKEGLKLRWRKAKGLPYDDEDYKRLLEACKGQNKSAPALRLSSTLGRRFLNNCNIPDGNWNA